MNPARLRIVAPFRPDYRAAGVLLHITSLPSTYGIGDVGPSAFAWVDRLAAAGQSWWQVLPWGPPGAVIRRIRLCPPLRPTSSSSARTNWLKMAFFEPMTAEIPSFLLRQS